MTEGSGDSLIYRSHRAIRPFRLHRPTTVDEAVRAHADDPEATFLAGGVDLIPALRRGRKADTVIHLGGIEGLATIERRDGMLTIGGAATYRQLETDRVLKDCLPDLAEAWRQVANIRVRCAGTLGGNLMSGNATYDALPALTALGAQLHFATTEGEILVDLASEKPEAQIAELPAAALLARVTVPLDPEPRLHVDRSFKPVAALFLARRNDRYRAAVACAHTSIAAANATHEEGAHKLAERLPPPISDHWASAAYRERLISTLLGRAFDTITTETSPGGGA